MRTPLTERLTGLPKTARCDLQALWAELFGKPPARALSIKLLVPIIAYRLQELELGPLKPSFERRLRDIVMNDTAARRKDSFTRPKPGTRFIREWQGKLHEMTVLPEGFEYRDRTFDSLSEIAREITGTRWSGPAFFGIRRRKKAATS